MSEDICACRHTYLVCRHLRMSAYLPGIWYDVRIPRTYWRTTSGHTSILHYHHQQSRLQGYSTRRAIAAPSTRMATSVAFTRHVFPSVFFLSALFLECLVLIMWESPRTLDALHALIIPGCLAFDTIAADTVAQVFSQLADLHQGAVTFIKVSMGCALQATYQV